VAVQEPGPVIGGDDEAVPPQDDLASVVSVEKNEDVAAVCGRVDGAPTWAVVIHAPDGNRQLSTELGMRRLIHHAADAGKVIAIATRSSSLGSRARELGLPVSRKPQHIRWDAGGRRVMRMGRLNIAPPSLGRYVQVGFIAAVALAGVYLLFAMAPSASVTAYPPTETVSELVSLTASEDRSEADLDAMEVPATRVSSEQKFTLALKTTGTTQVGVLPAKAVVTVSNSSAAAVAIINGTVVNAGAQRQAFIFDNAVTVPAGGAVEAAVTALSPGAVGNVAAATITAFAEQKFAFLTVTNAAPAAGGTSEPRPAVDAKDVVALRELARALETSDAVKEGLLAARPHDAIFLGTAESTVEFGEARPAVGTPADVVLLDVAVTLSALAVVEETLDMVARRVLGDRADAGEFVEGSVRATETGARQLDSESGTIRTEVLVQGELARGTSASAIREAVKGKSETDARSTLSDRYGIQDADVRLSSWAPRLPRFGFRIDVKLAARETPSPAGTNSLNDARTSITTASTPTPGAGSR
jgi:hypothetical protein